MHSRWKNYPVPIFEPPSRHRRDDDHDKHKIESDATNGRPELEYLSIVKSGPYTPTSINGNKVPNIFDHPYFRSSPRVPQLPTIKEGPESQYAAKLDGKEVKASARVGESGAKLAWSPTVPVELHPNPISKELVSLRERIVELTKENGRLNQVLAAKIKIIQALNRQNSGLREDLRVQIAVKNGTLRALSNSYNKQREGRSYSIASLSLSERNSLPDLRRPTHVGKTPVASPGVVSKQAGESRKYFTTQKLKEKLRKRKSLPNLRALGKRLAISTHSEHSSLSADFDASQKSWLHIDPETSKSW